MAVTRSTLALTRRLRTGIGREADNTDQALTASWVTAWDRIAPTWRSALTGLAETAVRDGRWPDRLHIARNPAVVAGLDAAKTELDALAAETAATAAAATERVVALDADMEPRIIASQAPPTQQEALHEHLVRRVMEQTHDDIDLTDGGMSEPPTADKPIGPAVVLGMVAGRIDPSALAFITARAAGRIHANSRPLTPEAVDAMIAALIEGIIVGDNPGPVATDMLRRVEGQFNGGLTRALTISRTEMLDAYRSSSAYMHRANRDLVTAWQWWATLGTRCCAACWSRHGRTYPVSEPGPDDHPRGRCTRLPKLASWAELGITAPEPPSAVPDAEQTFRRLSRTRQLEVMGPGRLALLDSGAVTWDDLATWRDTPDWRRSNQPTTVRDLQRLADTRRQEGTRV